MKSSKSLAVSAVWVFVITILSKVLALVREMVVSFKFGASALTDAYFVAFSIPTILFACLLSGITNSYLPIISRLDEQKRKNALNGNTMLFMCVACLAIAFVMFFLKDKIISVIAPGFNGDTKTYAVLFAGVFVFLLPAKGMFNVIASYLNYIEDFVSVTVFDYIIVNLISIAAFLFASEDNSILLPLIFVLGYFAMTVISFFYSVKKGFGLCLSTKKESRSDFISLLRLALPYGLSLMITQLNALIDRTIASTLPVGSVSYLNYSNNIIQLVLTLTITIYATVTLPLLNRQLSSGDFKSAGNTVSRGISLSEYVCIPVTLGIIFYANDIIRIIYMRGSFDSTALAGTTGCLVFYGIGLLFYAMRRVITAVLSANKMTTHILINSAITVASNIVFNLIFIRFLGVNGLALGTSVAGLLSFILILMVYRRTFGANARKFSVLPIGKIILCSLFSVGISFLLHTVIKSHLGSFSIAISILVAMLLYYMSTRLLRVNEAFMISEYIKRMLHIKKGNSTTKDA